VTFGLHNPTRAAFPFDRIAALLIRSCSSYLEGSTIYAVVRTGGKQYRVQAGETIDVELLSGAAPGAEVEFEDVLLVAAGDKVTVGAPTVPGASVKAEIVDDGRDKKVIIFKYKAKTRSRKKRGHRQPFTRLAIKEIVGGA
jgi:large subunit ribosomal protein L21